MWVLLIFPGHSDRVFLSKVDLFSFAVPTGTVDLCTIFYQANNLIHKVKLLFGLPIYKEIIKLQIRRVVKQHWHHFENGFHEVVVVLLCQFKLTLPDHIRHRLVVQQKRIVNQRQVRLCIPLHQPKHIICYSLLLCADVRSKTHFSHLGLQVSNLLLKNSGILGALRRSFNRSLLDYRSRVRGVRYRLHAHCLVGLRCP